jgi:hypothetical protein
MVERTKYAKLYGWELAFKRVISKARAQGNQVFVKLAFGRSIDYDSGLLDWLPGNICHAVIASQNNKN